MAGGALCWRQWREVGSGDELALVAVCANVNMNGTGVNGTGVNGTGVNDALGAVFGRQL